MSKKRYNVPGNEVRMDIANSIITSADHGRLALLLGNGIDLAISDKGIKWTDLLIHLAKALQVHTPSFESLIKEGRLLLAADYLSAHNRRELFKAELKAILREIQWTSTPARKILMKMIAKLNPQYILTTNYTDAIEIGLREIGFRTFSVHGDDDIVTMNAQHDTPIIYMHGNYQSPVLRYADYFEHRHRNPRLWSLVTNILQDTSMVSLGIELGESEFDIYETLYAARLSNTSRVATHILFTASSGEFAETRTEALEERFGLQVVGAQPETSYLQFYINTLSRIIERSHRPYIGVNVESTGNLGVFCGLFTRNVVIYPEFIDGKSTLFSQVERNEQGATEPLPNTTVYNRAIVECVGGAATVAAATFSKLSTAIPNRRGAIVFAKGPMDQHEIERLGRMIDVGLDGVEISDKSTVSVILNNPNQRQGDERVIFDIRHESVYDGYTARLESASLTGEYMSNLAQRCRLLYFDRWGSAWLEGAESIIRQRPDIPVLLDTGWTGGEIGRNSIEPESEFGLYVSHLLASSPPMAKYLQFSLGLKDVDITDYVCKHPQKVFTALKEKIFKCLRVCCITQGKGDIICLWESQSSINCCKIPSIQVMGQLAPMNPLGCGDVWRGAYARAVMSNQDDWFYAPCVGTLAAYWHMVGGIDYETGESKGLKGIPESIPNWADIQGLVRSYNSAEIAKWKEMIKEKTGISIEEMMSDRG